jgi:hypothetical protein
MNGSYEVSMVEANYDNAKALLAVYVIGALAVISFLGGISFLWLSFLLKPWLIFKKVKSIFSRVRFGSSLSTFVSGVRSLLSELWDQSYGIRGFGVLFFDLFSDLFYCYQLLTGRYVSDTFQIPLSMLIILIIFQFTGMINAIFFTKVLRADLDDDNTDDDDKSYFEFWKEVFVFVFEDFVETIIQFIFVDKFISEFQLLPTIKSWVLFLYSVYKLWEIIKYLNGTNLLNGNIQFFFLITMLVCGFMFNLFRVLGVTLYQFQFLSSADCFNNDLNGTNTPINGTIGLINGTIGPIKLQTPGLCFQWVDWGVLIFGSPAFIIGCLYVSWYAWEVKIGSQIQKLKQQILHMCVAKNENVAKDDGEINTNRDDRNESILVTNN